MYRNILVPVDGSPTGTRGLREAIRLAHSQRARLTLLHVLEDYAHDDILETATFSPGLFALLRENGRRILERAANLARRSGVVAKTVMAERPGWLVADVIVEEARKARAGLIVIGTHGRRGVRRLVLGSDAEQVVRLAAVPVMLVRAREQKPAKRRRRTKA